MFKRFRKDERGTSAVEYGIIIVGLSLVIIGGVGTAGNSLSYLWGNNNSKLNEVFQKTIP
jgi:pilus assembly protein Flp/PilA